MKLDDVLEGYEKRASIIGAYQLLISTFINRMKFTDFTNEEFTNLVFQILCFLMEKSFKRENCFMDDISSFIFELDNAIYGKNISDEDLKELALYIINGLHGSKSYKFNFFNSSKKGMDFFYIQLIEDKNVKVDNNHKLSYSLTDDGYRLLLSTKEYDEMIQIEIKQVIAKLRIEKGDFDGAKDEIRDVIVMLENQFDKIEKFVKEIRKDIFHIRKESFWDVLKNLLASLEEQGTRYEQISIEIEKALEDKNQLSINNKVKGMDTAKIEFQLESIKSLKVLVNRARHIHSRLISRTQESIKDYDEILYRLLRIGIYKRFNFREVVLNAVEEDINKLDNLKNVYRDLFKLKQLNLFTLDVPYKQQSLLINQEEPSIIDEDNYEVCINEDKIKTIENYEQMYVFILGSLIEYGIIKQTFTLREFLNYLVIDKQPEYLKFTADAMILRNMLMSIVDIKTIVTKDIVFELSRIAFSPSIDFQIQKIFGILINKIDNFITCVNQININQLEESISFNTEIDLEQMTSKKLTMPNIKFEIL